MRRLVPRPGFRPPVSALLGSLVLCWGCGLLSERSPEDLPAQVSPAEESSSGSASQDRAPLKREASVKAQGASESGTCPPGMVAIPGGSYPVGSPDPPPDKWYQLRSATVEVEGFCIDRYEFPNKVGELPRGDISWDDARALCDQAGKRFCLDFEWAAACRGFDGWAYSYGPEFERGRCNTGGYDKLLEPIGSRPQCQSPLGVHDLNGSQSEWVQDTWKLAPLPPLDPDMEYDPKNAPHRTLRGGTRWGAIYGQNCLSRHSHRPQDDQEDDGFRCCVDPLD